MRRHRTSGQSLVEFSLVIPLFLTLLVGVVDMGRVIWASNTLGDAARQATRFAIVHGDLNREPPGCAVGPAGPDVTQPWPTPYAADCPHPSPSKQSIVDAATAAALAAGGPLTVTVCYGTGCSGNSDAQIGSDQSGNPYYADNSRGTPVTVVVSADIGLVVPSLLGFSRYGFALLNRGHIVPTTEMPTGARSTTWAI